MNLESTSLPALTPVDPFLYDDQRDCWRCGGKVRFVPVYRLENGWWGYCWGCGEERVEPFSRTTEAA